MGTTLYLLLFSLLFVASGCSVAGNSEAVVLDTIEPGVQKVTPLVDRNTFMPDDNSTAPWYRVYDDQTKQWYPAEKNSSGAWALTKTGEEMRAEDLETLSQPDEDKVTQWRNDTTGFTYSPSLRSTNATGSDLKVRPTPALDLERRNANSTVDTDEAEEMSDGVQSDQQVLWDDSSAEDTAQVADTATESADPDGMREVPFAGASTMTLEGRGPTWVTAVIDGGDSQDYFIRDGETINLFFGTSLKLEVGNAQSVLFTLDGDPYPVSSSGKATIRIP